MRPGINESKDWGVETLPECDQMETGTASIYAATSPVFFSLNSSIFQGENSAMKALSVEVQYMFLNSLVTVYLKLGKMFLLMTIY